MNTLLATFTFLLAAAPQKAPDTDWPTRLPADTWLAVKWDGAEFAGPVFDATPLGRILAEPQTQRWIKEALSPALAMLGRDAGEWVPGPVADDLGTLAAALRTGRARLVVLGMSAPDGGPPAPQIILTVGPNADADAFFKALESVEAMVLAGLAHTRGADGKPIRPQARQVDGQTVKTLRLPGPGAGIPVSWGRAGRDMVVTVGAAAAEIVFDGKKPAALLTNDAGFDQLARSGVWHHGHEPGLITFLNVAAIRAFGEKLMPPQAAKAFEILGLRDVRAVGESVRIEDGAFRTVTAMAVAKRGGLLNVFAGKPIGDADLAMIPRGARHVLSVPFEPAVLWDNFFELMRATGNPASVAQAGRDLAELKETLGFDLRADLLAVLGGRMTVMAWPDDALPVVGGATVVFEIKDRAKAGEVFDKVRAALADAAKQGGALRLGGGVRFHARPTVREFRGHKIDTINLGVVAPAWTLTDRHLVAGITPQAVMDYLLFLDDKAAPTIKDNPDFAARFKTAGAGELLIYSDVPAWWPDLHAAVIMALNAADVALAQERRRGDPPFSLRPELFPSVGAVAPHLFGAAASGGWAGDVYTFRTVSPLPILPPAAAKLIAIPALVLPAVAKVQGSARRSQALMHLAQVGVAAHSYAVAKAGRGPPTLEALVKEKFLENDSVFTDPLTGGRMQLLLPDADFGRRAAESILAAFPNPGGPVAAVFCDGHVQMLTPEEFRAALDQLRNGDRKADEKK